MEQATATSVPKVTTVPVAHRHDDALGIAHVADATPISPTTVRSIEVSPSGVPSVMSDSSPSQSPSPPHRSDR